MGRFATTAIIALALAGAAVESHADDRAGVAPAKGAGVPIEQLLADVTPAPAPGPAAVPAPEAPPPDAAALPPGSPMGMMPRPPGPDAMGWPGPPNMRPDRQDAMWRMHEMEQTWGLFFNQRDKNLSDSDVQTLAEAVLLVHGNHDWKVIDVADAADGEATFAYATADGSVVARFRDRPAERPDDADRLTREIVRGPAADRPRSGIAQPIRNRKVWVDQGG